MRSRRYTIVVADRNSGAVRRFTISARPVVGVTCAVLIIPMLVGAGAVWKGRAEVASLYAAHDALKAENASYRAATEELATQIETLQVAISDLGARAALDPTLARAMEKLPAFVKARAMGGTTTTERSKDQDAYVKTLSALAVPEDTFGLLRSLLEGLQNNLLAVRKTVDRRNALANATPSIWPSRGWLTSTMGHRQDPVTGNDEFHAGLDIAGDRGQPVYATASGTVKSAGYQGDYGNLVTLDHGFGLQTRYGHLASMKVKPGTKVQRGDVIGLVGNTGRATGYHLHYEVLANGRLLNPLQLLTQKPRDQ